MKNLKYVIEHLQSLDYDKLPDLELYMDQVTTFLDEKLAGFKRNETDKIITKTMINNYSKDKVILPSLNKKYSRLHLIQIILIYHLKSSLSIDDIKKLLGKYLDNETKSNQDILKKKYNDFERILSVKKDDLLSELSEENFIEKYSGDIELFVLSCAVEIELKKLLIERIIDQKLSSEK